MSELRHRESITSWYETLAKEALLNWAGWSQWSEAQRKTERQRVQARTYTEGKRKPRKGKKGWGGTLGDKEKGPRCPLFWVLAGLLLQLVQSSQSSHSTVDKEM